MIWWNRHWWFWVYPRQDQVGLADIAPSRPARFWYGRWYIPGWYVWAGAPRSWVRPNYWGGVGCSCDDGHCCRRCPNRIRFHYRCRACGNNEDCRASLCRHPCCAQVSPERVVERLAILYPPLHQELTEALEYRWNIINNIAGYIVDEPFAYG